MKKLVIFFLLVLVHVLALAQTVSTRNAYVGFFSKTPLEDIRAENNQVNAVIDLAKKNMAFALLVKSFLFQKELMQEHFNENYAESDQYPKATFAGSYSGDVDAAKEGVYNIRVNGQLTFHGVTRTIDVPATVEVRGNQLRTRSSFQLRPADFNIKIPALVREKIAQQMDVVVKAEYHLTK